MLVCGSGAGVAVAACKFPGIRAVVAHDTYTAHQSVEHDDCNILCLGGRVIGPALAADIIRAYLAAEFTGEDRHKRRLAKIDGIEREFLRDDIFREALRCEWSNATSAARRSRRPTTRSWSGALKDHLLEEHDESPDDDEIQQTIDREAYDATDS